MGVTVTVLGKAELLAALGRAGGAVIAGLRDAMEDQMVRTADHARSSKFGGDPLNRRTGRLSTNIHGSAEVDGRTVVGSIGVNVGEVPYAPVHEYGGTFSVREHYRRAAYNARLERVRLLTRSGSVRAEVLRGGALSRGIVRAHEATYPQRAFLRPSLDERRTQVLEALRANLLESLSAA